MKINNNRNWLVFDEETDAFDGSPVEPFIFGVKERDGAEFIFWDEQEFINYLREFDGIALAHNGGKFDTVLLAEHFERGEIKIINGRVAEVKIGKCSVRDSFLIIPAPLSASGLKDDFDYTILDRKNKHLRKKHKTDIEKYLRQDCRALWELVHAFYGRFGQRLTQAGAALATWENELGGMKRRWGGEHDKAFRPFYFGGRCDAFEKGILGDGWQYFDIKSAYPYAMTFEHAASHVSEWFVHTDISRITPQSFARIIATSKGCLPIKGKNVTEYPYDTTPREYFASGWEIIAGLETGTLTIERAKIWRPNHLESFENYVYKFYAEKLKAEKDGDAIARLIAKIFLNSLYGKYGSAADEYKEYKLVDAGDREAGWSLYAEVGELDIIQTPNAGQFFDVAAAASVTGFVRAFNWRQICKVRAAGYRIGYMDTDSNLCKGAGVMDLYDIGDNLGQWEHVCTMNDFHVAGKKLYAGRDITTRDKKTGEFTNEWITAHKGFSKLDTSYLDVIAAARGEIPANRLMNENGGFKIGRSAPSINASGRQNFLERTMRRT